MEKQKEKRGKVYLVGAGPGDSGLMTVRGSELLRQADVVVHDRLIGEEVTGLIPESAEKINVGKFAGDHPFPQDQINRILADKAKEGKQVVRLKGGDPFIFGRGGEELETLCREGIDFEVVPGITSAVAAAAYAGIPVTHRDYCSSLHFITGHAQAGRELRIDFNELADMDGTLVFFMSISTAPMIAEGLMGAGMDPEMPTAVIENGTRSDQRSFIQPLSELAKSIEENEIVSPALIIVGHVCELSDQFGWFEKLPLKGKHFLVTRPESGASRMAEGLKRLGAKVTVRPAIKTSPIRPIVIPKRAEKNGAEAQDDYDTVVFTSAAGVRSFCDWLFEEDLDMRWFAQRKVACIGSATASALKARGINSDLTPSIFSGQALGEEMIEKGFVSRSSRVLLLRTDIASRDITDILEKEGVAFSDVPVYETKIIEYKREETPKDVDVITFTSRSCVEGFISSITGCDEVEDACRRIPALCIGEKTAEAARAAGFEVICSKEATIDSMLEKAQEL